MADPKNITEETTIAELGEQLLLLDVIALRIYPPLDNEAARAACMHHATGFHVGHGPTEATAIEAAFSQLRRALLPEALKPYAEVPAEDP
jgi:hypothetical protein